MSVRRLLLFAGLVLGSILVGSIAFGLHGHAQDDRPFGPPIPLDALAGHYSPTTQGYIARCFTLGGITPVKCGTLGAITIPQTLLQVGDLTRDVEGNTCGTFTQTLAHFPVDSVPTQVSVVHVVGRVKSYDPETGTGDASFTTYVGGTCRGVSFDSVGATVTNAGTNHFAACVDRNGVQINSVVTSLSGQPDTIAAFSLSGIGIQNRPHQ